MALGVADTIELLGNPKGCPINVTVADGTAISGGTLLKLSDPMTGAASSAAGDKFLGIAMSDKVANDGNTTIAAATKGIFNIDCVGAAGSTAGDMVVISGASVVSGAGTGGEVGLNVGKSLETVAANVDEKIRVAIGIY